MDRPIVTALTRNGMLTKSEITGNYPRDTAWRIDVCGIRVATINYDGESYLWREGETTYYADTHTLDDAIEKILYTLRNEDY